MTTTRRGLLLAVPTLLIPRRPALAVFWAPFMAASGYNNLTNWPSAANRPQMSGNTMSWIGPVGGGPSTASDWPQSLVLTTQSSDVISSSDGQLIYGLNMPGNNIWIQNNNVTVRNCNAQFIYNGGSGFTGTVIEDCQFNKCDGGYPYPTLTGLLWNATIRRCTGYNTEDCVAHIQNNMTIVDCWFHDMVGSDCDMIEFYGDPSRGGNSNNCTVSHCTFDGRDLQSGAYANSGINLSNFIAEVGNVTNITITNCAFLDSGNGFNICDDCDSGGVVEFSCTNCGFWGAAAPRRDTASGATSISPNSGNYIMVNVTDTSGSPVNGTGSI